MSNIRIHQPDQFHELSLDIDTPITIHRISEHHANWSEFRGWPDSRFIIHAANDIWIVPGVIQSIMEYCIRRGELQQGKADANALHDILSFKDVDVVAGVKRKSRCGCRS